MAAILEVLLNQEVTPDAVVSWLKNRTDLKRIPKQLKEYSKLDQEFVPFFLNYLRDQTLHLLQSNRSANPSPAKTPSTQKLKKTVHTRREDGGKRVQLFGSSPGDGLEDIRDTSSSVFSPNVSIDSPGVWKNLNTPSSAERSGRGRGHRTPGSRDQRQSPHCGSRQSNATPDSHGHRAKQRFSLGEFIVSPDVDINQNSKKNSPYSGGRKDHSFDNSPSPLPVNGGKRSSGKKRHPANRTDLTKPAPVFSLNSVSDFPPMGGEMEYPIRKPDQKEESVLCTPYMKNSPNFDATPRGNAKPTVITKSRRISFTTLSEESTDSTQMPSRRIKPTPIQGNKAWHHNRMFLDSAQNSKETHTLAGESEGGTDRRGSLIEERELLRQEKAKRLQQGDLSRLSGFSSPGGPMTPTKYLERSNSVLEIAVADPSFVTHQDQLDVLAELYSCCLKENLLPNLAVEIYFVVQLMTSRSADTELVSSTGGLDTIDTNFFCSVHNAVYFAVKVLESQVSFLRCLDRCTLRLLSENQRIASFSETLIDWLTLEHDSGPKPVPAFPKSPIGGVSFQAETDNRKNFPNDCSFHLFKKQRDTFYELLREWEAHHMSSGWSVAAFLGDKIRALINFKTELANHIHFARLFQSQLITMCKGDGSLKPDGDDEGDALLSQLKRTNPEKFKRLQERFIMPLSVGGPCPAPSFPGCQEFFRDFIMAASSPIFNQHLTDTFSAKVMELNEISIASREETPTEQDATDDEEKDRFVSCLMTVRLVAKFLGFVTFLPYQTGSRISDELSAMYISLRSHSIQIDLARCLKTAFFLGQLTLTVPWVVEFLSMMDQIAPNLEPIQIALFVLLYIHQQTWGSGQFTNTCYANLLVITTISWLFENAVIPEGFFFSEIPGEVVSMGTSLDHQTGVSLDRMGFVDQKLYYTCCPYMGEIRTLLVEFSVGSSSKNSTIRKITPISADDRSQPSMTERQTQLHLEENFFHNHPASLRRTVDFVADRTASNYIKRFRSTLLVSSIRESKTRLSDHMETQENSSPTAKAKDKLQSQLLKISQDCVQQVKATSATEVEGYCEKKIDAALTLLLPDEQSRTVVTMATKICLRITMEKIQQWMTKHITTAMYQSELQTELERILKAFMLTQQKSNEAAEAGHPGSNVTLETEGCTDVIAKEHDHSVPSPSDVLIEIKQVVRGVTFGRVVPSEVEIKSVISQVQTVIKKRQDVLPGVYVAYGQLVMDLCLALVQCSPDQWSNNKLDVFFVLWRTDLEKFTPLRGFLCPRVVLQMNNCSNPKLTWSVYSRVLMRLLEEHLLSCVQLSKMCQNTLQAIQDDVTNLGWCMCDVVDHIHGRGLCVSPLTDILDWLLQLAGLDSLLAKRITRTTKLVCQNQPTAIAGPDVQLVCPDPIIAHTSSSVKLVCPDQATEHTDKSGRHKLEDVTVYLPIVHMNQGHNLTCSKSDTSELDVAIKRTEEITLANHSSFISNSVT
ncbi:codanin-1-like isoform X2 [Mizuhopecten yessoensis]|uniref:Codanin-1 n=1 Tax=Mizuhopecten yessoensis TaxID=6573 RepID=A0A210QBN6_MIZYE|nr:codanin-1-like isoform X2 [Mizuhopecten yessoensis]OWF46147.1 Codanin-1 [Mizuhopecten yessoensis]